MRIEIVGGTSDVGRTLEWDGTEDLTIGRAPDCGLQLRDPEVSRTHARLTVRDGGVWVQDLESHNGTYVNERRIREIQLFPGDQIQVGQTRLRVSDLPGPRLGSAPPAVIADDSRTVLVSLRHDQADILRGAVSSATLAEMMRENRILREVGRLTQSLAARGETAEALRHVLTEVLRLLEADAACVLTRPAGSEEWEVRAAAGAAARDGRLNVSRTILHRAVEEGVALLIADAATDPHLDASRSIRIQGVSSALCSPFDLGESRQGVLFVDRRRRARSFESSDLSLVATLATMIGIFLQREQYELDARQKARLAAVGEVVAELAHQIKNIVTGLKLAVSNLSMACERQRLDLVGTCVRTIADIEMRISELMLNMLSYSKDRVPVRTEIHLPKFFDRLFAPYADALREKRIAVSVNVAPGAERLYADEAGLQRVFLNLFLNSLDAIEARGRAQEAEISVRASPIEEGRRVEIRFRDTGEGIPSDILPRLFTAFFSTKGSRGTGLGLAVVGKIVREHGGEVTVASEPGQWTEFTVRLPVGPPSSAGAQESPSRA